MDNLLKHQEKEMDGFHQQTERTEEDFASDLIDRVAADTDFL